MKKKFLAMYALAGALVASPVFTSCIDDTESASVTAVRNAKAAQIKATADYEAKMNEVNLALKQLELETNQMNLEQSKAEYERYLVQTEQYVAQAKYYIAQYTQQMYNYQDLILTELTGNYTEALDKIVEYKQNILDKKADVVALEDGIINLQEYVVGQTETLNENIASAEAKIELWKDAEGGVNKEEINAEITALDAEKEKLRAEQTALNVEYGSFDIYQNVNTIEDIYKKVDVKDGQGNQLYWQLDGSQGTSSTATDDKGTPDDTTDDATINLQKVQAYELNANGDRILTNNGLNYYYNLNPTKLATIEAARKLHKLSVNTSYNFLTKDAENYLILSQSAVTAYKQDPNYGQAAKNLENAKNSLAKLEAALGTEADKADTKYQATATTKELTAYAVLAAAKAELETAKKAYDPKKEAVDKAEVTKNEKATALSEANKALADEKAKGDKADAAKVTTLTAAQAAAKTAYDAAEKAYNTANDALTQEIIDAYDNAVTEVATKELAVAQAIDAINTQKVSIVNLETAAELEAEFETYLAAFEGDDYAAYKAAVDALAAKEKEIKDIETEKSALQELLTCTDVEALIAEQEEKIEGWKEDLAALENATKSMSLPSIYGSSWDNYSEADIEAVIALVKEQIANLEIKLELEEKRAEQAKAALDAYLGTEEEGDTETEA